MQRINFNADDDLALLGLADFIANCLIKRKKLSEKAEHYLCEMISFFYKVESVTFLDLTRLIENSTEQERQYILAEAFFHFAQTHVRDHAEKSEAFTVIANFFDVKREDLKHDRLAIHEEKKQEKQSKLITRKFTQDIQSKLRQIVKSNSFNTFKKQILTDFEKTSLSVEKNKLEQLEKLFKDNDEKIEGKPIRYTTSDGKTIEVAKNRQITLDEQLARKLQAEEYENYIKPKSPRK